MADLSGPCPRKGAFHQRVFLQLCVCIGVMSMYYIILCINSTRVSGQRFPGYSTGGWQEWPRNTTETGQAPGLKHIILLARFDRAACIQQLVMQERSNYDC